MKIRSPFTMSLESKANAIASFSFAEETEKIIRANEGFLIKLLQDQLSAGFGGDEEPIRLFGSTEYSKETIRLKSLFGSPPYGKITDHVTLFMHGEFYNSLKFFYDGKEFFFVSNVSYADNILFRSGDKVIELTRYSMSVFQEEILKPQLLAAWKSRISQ